MFFRFKRRFNLLSVDDTYAHLLNVRENDDLVFEFRYGVKQLDVIQHEALTVRVSVLTHVRKRKPIVDTSHRGKYNTDGIVRNVLKLSQQAKTNIKERESLVVATKNSDISSKINNEILPQLRAGVPKEFIQHFKKTALSLQPVHELRDRNEVRPVFQMIAHSSVSDTSTEMSSSLSLKPRQVMHDMIVRQGIDPSSVVDMTHRSVSARNAFEGLSRKTKSNERDFEPATRLLHKHIFSHTALPDRTSTKKFDDNVRIPVSNVSSSDELEIPVVMLIPAHARHRVAREDFNHYVVKFELVDGRTGATIDVVTKPLDVARHLKLFNTPRRAPSVSVVSAEANSHVNIEIRQRDKNANAVQLYKKVIPRASVTVEDYVLIGTYDLKRDEYALNVRVDQPRSSTAVYRVIPVGEQSTQGYEFTNVIVKPDRYKPVKAIALSTKSIDTGVEIDVRSLPPNVVSVELLVRNLTTHERNYRNIDGITFIDDATREADSFSLIDGNVNEYNVYEYAARLIYKDGLTSTVEGLSIHEFTQPAPGKVDIRIDNVQVDNDAVEPNVTFTVTSTILDSDLDIVKKLLEKQGVDSLFADDILKQRDALSGLIAHNIQRVNLTTGVREDFGTVTDDVFSDASARSNSAVSALRVGDRYRYEVSTLIRAPETLFDDLVKKKTDAVTKKNYQFKPAKFLHPITLREGTIVTSQGLKTRYSKDALSHGKIGTTQYVDVALDGEPAAIIDFQATRFDKNLNVLTWKVRGAIDQVDHFLLMKDVHGVRTVIGKAHSEFAFGNAQYIHEISKQDFGEMTYVVVPIFNNYELGDEVFSNAVIVE